MADAGHISIEVNSGVSIATTRPADLGRVFRGRTAGEAIALAPLLFSVCANAQQAACRMALANAGEYEAGDSTFLVAFEAIREHLLRIALDWAEVAGCVVGRDYLVRLNGLVKLAKTDCAKATAEADELARCMVDGESSVARKLMARVREEKWESLGALEQFEGDDESSCYMLVRHAPAIEEIERRHGDGLLARLAARLVHLSELQASLRDKEMWSQGLPNGEGTGAAHVNTARGVLTHRAVFNGGRIENYEVVAPTDRNFKTGGPLARRLAALVSACNGNPAVPARLLVDAYDPCVSYSLRVH